MCAPFVRRHSSTSVAWRGCTASRWWRTRSHGQRSSSLTRVAASDPGERLHDISAQAGGAGLQTGGALDRRNETSLPLGLRYDHLDRHRPFWRRWWRAPSEVQGYRNAGSPEVLDQHQVGAVAHVPRIEHRRSVRRHGRPSSKLGSFSNFSSLPRSRSLPVSGCITWSAGSALESHAT